MANAVYDTEPEQEELKSSKDDLRDAEQDAGGDGGFYNDEEDSNQDSSGSESDSGKTSGKDLDKAEKKAGESDSKDGGLFSDEGDSSKKGGLIPATGLKGLLSRNKKKSGLGAIIATCLTIVTIMGFLLSGPLKVEHIVSNLQKRFFSSAEDATEKASEKMMKRYIIKHVLPSYRNCGTTVSKKCSVGNVSKNSNPVNNLYRSWANARIENKLADKYGIEIKREQGTWKVKTAGASAKGIDIGRNGEKIDDLFSNANRAQVRAVIREATAKETRWKKLMLRYKVGRLLETKYGIKRCIIFCGTRDTFADKKDEKKLAAKIYLVDRVITPRNESMGIVLTCLMTGCINDADKTKPSDTGDAPALKGAPENDDVDKATREALEAYAQNLGMKNADELIGKYKEISEKGFQKYLVEVALKHIVGDVAAKRASNLVPVIGWINFASMVVQAADGAGPALKKLRYVVNAAPMVATFMMYRSYADEVHTHKVDPIEVGSMVNSLGKGDVDNKNDPIKGGSASAENSPLYAHYMGGTIASAGSISNLFFASSSAETAIDYKQTVTNNAYKCNSGKTTPKGKLICPEEELGGGNSVANAIHDGLNSPALKGVVILSDLWSSTIGKAFALADTIIGGILGTAFKIYTTVNDAGCSLPIKLNPGYCAARDLAEEYAPQVLEAVTTLLIPNPFSSNMSGGRTFNMIAGGANVAGNDYAHTGLGGKALTDQEVADIRNEQITEDKLVFENKSVFAKMFDTESSYSAVSQVAMAVPLDIKSTYMTRIMSVVTSPVKFLSTLLNGLASKSVFAAETPSKDPFGVVQYGYPAGSIPDDPEAYWQANCKDDASQAYQNDKNFEESNWNQAAADNVDKDTGMPKNTQTNPCMLIKDTVGVMGGAYDTDLLTEDDLKNVGGSSGASSTQTTEISGSAQELAKKIVDSGNVTGSGQYMQQIKDVANGKTGCNVNPDILKMLVGVAINDNHKIIITSLNRKCTGQTPGAGTKSYHYSDGGGHAVDIGNFNGERVDGGNSATLKFLESASKYLPEGTGYGQATCGSGFKAPEGSTAFYDTCDHQHIQVPKKQMSES